MLRKLETKRGVEISLIIWLIWFAAACIEVTFDPFGWMATNVAMKPVCIEQMHQVRSVAEGIHLLGMAPCETPMTIGVLHHVSGIGLIIFAVLWLRAKARFESAAANNQLAARPSGRGESVSGLNAKEKTDDA